MDAPQHTVPVKVKICGLTNIEDARATVAAGADFLGFIFYPPSKRSISVAEARTLIAELRQLPAVPLLVGVFVNESADEIVRIMATCDLDLAQLSGDEVPYLVGDTQSPLYGRAYKALRPRSAVEAEVEAEWYVAPREPYGQPSLLLDAYHPMLYGGTGSAADWSMAAALAEQVPGLMLAGGLTAENVATAVQQVRPFAVDVASGVEAAPGRKDHDQVRAFVRNAKTA